jgi:hypothetical protein
MKLKWVIPGNGNSRMGIKANQRRHTRFSNFGTTEVMPFYNTCRKSCLSGEGIDRRRTAQPWRLSPMRNEKAL